MSWASIAKAQPKPSAGSSSEGLTAREGLRLLVVDANAIIDGVKLEGIADRALTIQEVLDEIRDKQSRQYLASLPYELEVSEPSEESIQAVTRFARATGDVAALSSVDIKLLALVHTLEVAAHGSDHLSTAPNQPRMHNKASFATEDLPGWGSVPNPADWKAVDEANDADEAALLAASTSRIAQHVQQLSLDPSAPNSLMQDTSAAAPTAVAASPAAPLTPQAVGVAPRTSTSPPSAAVPAAEASAAGVPAAAAAQQHSNIPPAAAGAAQEADSAAADGAADGWEVAASSKGAARHRKRKAVKRQQQQHAFEQEWAEHSELVQQEQQQLQQEQPEQQQGAEADEQPAADDEADAEDADSRCAEDASNEELLAEQHCVYTADDLAAPAAEQQQQQQQQAEGAQQQQAEGAQQQQSQQLSKPGSPGWQSSVAIITGDFAMQNVLLQMGLRLITKDGRRIARLTRYALRCSACFTVTREPGRLFCPKCGNLSLDRVEVVVGADGAEYFGVTKRHILRGTRFSLPKPKGGRTADELVLREDVFLQKVKALGKQVVKKKAADAEEAAAAAGVDPFAPEYNQDTWHVASQQELAQHRGLAAVLQPSWKHNPNERKLTRSNRRG